MLHHDVLHASIEHVHPASTSHVELHPSPSNEFPSSHASDPARRPSPHTVSHVSLLAPHVYPHSTWQPLEHPSPDSKFPSSQYPSSHTSLPNTSPSPHTGMHQSSDTPHGYGGTA